MKLYVYADGTISDEPVNCMSDDYHSITGATTIGDMIEMGLSISTVRAIVHEFFGY